MSEPSVEIVVGPPNPDPLVIVEPSPSETPVIVNELPPVVVVVEPPLPDIVVDIHEVGLPGPAGADGVDGVGAEEVIGALNDHVNSQNPHPVYDDGPSFLLLYLNAKV